LAEQRRASSVPFEGSCARELKLYVKVWCPWCVIAQEWLDERGYAYELIDVERSRAAYEEMLEFSGQQYTPTIVVDDEKVLPDFGPEELEDFFRKHSIEPRRKASRESPYDSDPNSNS
jgi:glutaredoxin 3